VIQYTWKERARENEEEYGHWNIIQWRHENNRRTMKPMGMDHGGGSQTTPSLLTSFSYDHIIICHLHCRHVTVRIETIIMYNGNVVLLGNHQHQSLLVSNDDRRNNSCCGGTVIHRCGLYNPPYHRMCASKTLLQFLVA
jgi:hypothetical protein